MKRSVVTGILGLAIGLLGLLIIISPLGLLLEETVGLHHLFQLRGARPAPAETVIVTMDMASLNHFNLDPKTKIWPRALHARMIERLSELGVNTIAMDIFFEKPRATQDDQRLADAFRKAGNVLLSSSIQINRTPLNNGQTKNGQPALLNIEKLLPPLPLFADAVVGYAPFPLPKVPVRISQFWTFKASSGDLPTFPTVAMHIFLAEHYDALIDLLASTGVTLPADLPRTRDELFRNNGLQQAQQSLKGMSLQTPELFKKATGVLQKRSELEPSRMTALKTLLNLYLGNDSRHLNYYGPPGSIRTISFHKLLDGTSSPKELNLKDKAVFIGLSQRLRLDQEDGYYTVFSQPDGSDISGVEIAATSFSNLLDGSWLKPLPKPAEMVLLLLWGLTIACGIYFLPLSISLPTTLLVSAAYVFFALNRFSSTNTWWPLAVPLLIQLPMGFLSTLMLKQHDIQQERRNIRKAFGYYLPDPVVNNLAKDLSTITNDSHTVHGTCLFTDAAQYTHLSETLPPDQLKSYLDRYYEILFKPIRHHGGFISDVIGDAVLGLWPTTEKDNKMRLAACTSALSIHDTLDQTLTIEDQPVLPTRIGIHAGQLQLGSVGALDHYEYRAVGEVVNTASRIEGLNKHLDTRILVSEQVVSGLDQFQVRPMGTFLLAGKSIPITLYELIGPKENINLQIVDLCALFKEGLEQFQNRVWSDAEALFNQVLKIKEEDGPATFYIKQCHQFKEQPPGDAWQGHIVMDTK